MILKSADDSFTIASFHSRRSSTEHSVCMAATHQENLWRVEIAGGGWACRTCSWRRKISRALKMGGDGDTDGRESDD